MIEITLPAMGEGIIEAEITRWLVKEGDQVNIDDPLVEVATDKVDSEVISTASGIMHKILLEEGDIPKVGQVLAMIRTAEEDEVGNPADPVQDAEQDKLGDENNTVIEMDRIRRLIADHMVYSTKVSPHVTSFVEADVTNLVAWREKVKVPWLEKYKEKLTYTPLLIEAVVKAIEEFPGINVSLDGYKIIQKKQINIGMATSLPSGNLIVPVIREANMKNLQALVSTVNDLTGRARENKLKHTDIQGSTFSITNLGQFGNISGTPIINQPEVAILAVGVIRKKPAVVVTPDGEGIGIRNMVILSLSYDHRVVDGALGGSFLKRIGDYLENADIEREI